MQKILGLLGLGGFGRKNSLEGDSHQKGKQDFVPTEEERDLLARYGRGNTTSFTDVRQQLVENGVPEERQGKVWEMIRKSRSEFQAKGGSPERHS